MSRRRAALHAAAQLLCSAAVLGWLARDAAERGLRLDLAALAPAPLLLALVVKALSLIVHQHRLHRALPAPRPAWGLVTAAGLIGGLLNMVLPARAGDAGLVAALATRLGVGWAPSTAAVARVTLMEIWVFGLACLGALRAAWRLPALDPARVDGVAAVLAAGVVGLGLGALGLRAWARRRRPDKGAGPALGGGPIGVDLGLTVLEIGAMIAAFTLAIQAAGAQAADPLSTTTLILAVSATAAALLPPAWGAGPAAACALVLGAQNVPQDVILRAAAAWWIVSQAPMAALGLLSLGLAPQLLRSPPAAAP